MSVRGPVLPVAAHSDLEVLGVLGRGGVATVYRVREPGTGTSLAWKVWHEPFDERVSARFDAECTLHTALSEHPHITRLVDRAHPVPGERPWILTELHEESLQDWLEDHRPTAAQWRTLSADVLAGLAAVHAAGHVHRDVKPANVLLRNGRWSLTDLGLAMPLDGHTQNGPAGTPFFVAPELGRPGAVPGARSDVYSAALLLSLVADDVSDPESVPGTVEDLLTRCASVHPLDRPADAGELLRRFLTAWPRVSSVPAPAVVPARREARLGGLCVALAVCLLLAGSTSSVVGASNEPAVSAERVACPQVSTLDATDPGDQPGLLEVSHIGYAVHGHISVELSGRLVEPLRSAAPGTLWVVSFPEKLPVGRDGRPGSELWYPLGALRPDADGCFATDALQASSYDGAFGVVFRMGLARLEPVRVDQARAWLAENSAEGWAELPAGVELLGTFDVDSGQFEDLDASAS